MSKTEAILRLCIASGLVVVVFGYLSVAVGLSKSLRERQKRQKEIDRLWDELNDLLGRIASSQPRISDTPQPHVGHVWNVIPTIRTVNGQNS